MADYFTHFSAALDVGSAEKANRAVEIFVGHRNETFDERHEVTCGFNLTVLEPSDQDCSRLLLHDDNQGDVEAVIRFVLRLAEELDLTGLWGFQYALTCSRARLDAFGGGAHVIDLGARKSIGWTSTREWLAAALNGEDGDA